MISDPLRYLSEYVNAGCEAITFHLEAVPEPVAVLNEIRRRGVVAGLAINPETPLAAAEPFLKACDLLLVMSVHPGFGGQKFIPDVVSKIRDARAIAGNDLIISVDGGMARPRSDNVLTLAVMYLSQAVPCLMNHVTQRRLPALFNKLRRNAGLLLRDRILCLRLFSFELAARTMMISIASWAPWICP